MADSPPEVLKNLKRTLVHPRPDLLRSTRQILREHEQMKRTIADLLKRVRRLEEGNDSPSDSPP